MSEQISTEALKAARFKLCRRIGAMLVSAMAETGMTYEEMAARIGREPQTVKKWIHAFVDGTSKDMDLVSDMALALNCEPHFELIPFEKVVAPVDDIFEQPPANAPK